VVPPASRLHSRQMVIQPIPDCPIEKEDRGVAHRAFVSDTSHTHIEQSAHLCQIWTRRPQQKKLLSRPVDPIMGTGLDRFSRIFRAFWFLIRIGDKREACDEIESALKSALAKEDGEEVFEIVDDLLQPDCPDLGERGRAIALRGARILDDMSKGEDPASLDLLALAYFVSGQADQARRYEEKAVALPGGDNPEFVKRLEQYRKAVEKQKKP
jgi:hypothetical protein